MFLYFLNNNFTNLMFWKCLLEYDSQSFRNRNKSFLYIAFYFTVKNVTFLGTCLDILDILRYLNRM